MSDRLPLFLYNTHFYLLDSIFQSSTTQAEDINRLHTYFLFAAGFILFVVIACTVLVLYKFRHKEGEVYEAKSLSQKWEILTIGIPMALVILFFIMTIRTMHRVLPSIEGRTPDVVITGHQFWWEANYPAQKVTTANEVHLPVGRPILLKLLSADVIHDWWIPGFGNKMDLVTGKENYIWFDIKKPGVYRGICNEFCGAQHAKMNIIVIAQNEQDYHQWLQQNSAKPMMMDNALAQTGAKIFAEKTCGNCHNIGEAQGTVTAGPNLTHLAGRQTLLTGVLVNNKENLKRWIENPQEIKPGARMPKFVFDKQSLEALATYLTSLK